MAVNSYKVLGLTNPETSNTEVVLYTVPSGFMALGSVLTICNQGATTGTCRIAVRPAGITSTAKTFILYDTSINPNDSLMLTLGLSLATTDAISVWASTTSFSFVISGSEVVIDTTNVQSVYNIATTSSVGMARPDNTSILITSGVISANIQVATSSVIGTARADGTSILINAGVLSAGYVQTSAVTTTSSWTMTQSSNGSLYFYYNGVAKFRFGADGVISAVSNIGAYITI